MVDTGEEAAVYLPLPLHTLLGSKHASFALIFVRLVTDHIVSDNQATPPI